MQSMPLLLRQSLRSSVGLARTSRSVRAPAPPTGPKALFQGKRSARDFSICLQCQFRTRPVFYASKEDGNFKDEKLAGQTRDADELDRVKREIEAEAEAGSTPPRPAENEQKEEQNTHAEEGSETGRLPSYIEERRSQLSKKFTNVMDNLQSNVFTAGQRLNDLTGYSAIEVLKKDIMDQEARVRETRSLVRQAKDAYAAAINRRSTSQREVNELLQRKHAWSPADLERFTHLYRNDHTNEVAETEAQEALSAAERQAEEAAARLSKSILSRYHEEQVWSDKIRRMSTWGTWGLMGVNVLLFLIFQVAVEPWRRKRLVMGFEEKVLEALEKENALLHAKAVNGGAESAAAPTIQTAMGVSTPAATVAEHDTQATAGEPSALPALEEITPSETQTETVAPPAEQETITTTTTLPESAQPESWPSEFPQIPSFSVESWRQYLHDLFSERNIAISQRDLTTVAIESAAAGAAVMGLLVAIFRPR